MADKKILELTELTAADAVTDFLPVVDSSADETKKIRFSNLPLSDSAARSTYPYTTDFHGAVEQTRNITTPLIYNQYYGDDTTLTSIYIGSNVPSIGLSAFIRCDALTDVTIANGITNIGESAFRSCTSLTSIIIPNSVTSIGDQAFRYCTDLKSATIGNNVPSIGDFAFQNCTDLTSVTIPDSVTSIGSQAFRYCTGLTSITIGNSVNTIEYRAFYRCSILTSVIIPDSVTSIADNVFGQCTFLSSITSLADVAPTLGVNVFAAVPATQIIVPVGATASYVAEGGGGGLYGGLTIVEAT